MIVISPHGGFGNRMRAMCGACFIAESKSVPLKHLWDGGSYKCSYPHIQRIHDCSFENFFESIIPRYIVGEDEKLPVCFTEWMPDEMWYPYQSYGQKKLGITALKRMETTPSEVPCLIETTNRTNPMTKEQSYDMYTKYFKPQERFMRELDPIVDGLVGISIRRGEFLKFFWGSDIPKNRIVPWLQSIQAPVILFSDDKSYQTEMRKCLRKPIQCSFETKTWTPEDRAFLEFLTFSRCSKLYGTPDSSFVQEAALFGNVPYEGLTQDVLQKRN